MTSKELIEKVIEDISLEWGYEGIEDELREKLKPLYEDLERLEDEFNDLCDSYHNLKQDFLEVENEKEVLVDACKNYLKEHYNTKKAIEILKDKKVNLFHIWVFDDYTQYKEHYPFSEYSATEDMLATEEFNFLKEVLECQKD